MTAKMKALRLLPYMLIGSGIIVATYFDNFEPRAAWSMVISAMTLVSAILGADVFDSAVRFSVIALSWGSVLLSSGFVLAVWICRETGVASLLIPCAGAIAWVVLQGKSNVGQKACRVQ